MPPPPSLHLVSSSSKIIVKLIDSSFPVGLQFQSCAPVKESVDQGIHNGDTIGEPHCKDSKRNVVLSMNKSSDHYKWTPADEERNNQEPTWRRPKQDKKRKSHKLKLPSEVSFHKKSLFSLATQEATGGGDGSFQGLANEDKWLIKGSTAAASGFKPDRKL